MGNLTYPLRREDFIAYQQGMMLRELSEGEIELLCLAAGYINEAHKIGKNGGELFPATVEDVEEIFLQMGKLERMKRPVAQQFFGALLMWLNEAYQAGLRDAGGGSDDDFHHTTAGGDEGGRADPAVRCSVVGENSDQAIRREQ